MHIHGTSLTVQAAGFYQAQMEQQAARRAAQTRKRLQRAASAAASASPEESLLLSQWLATPADVVRSAPMLAGDEYRSSTPDDSQA